MKTIWDDMLKTLVRDNQQAFVSLLLAGATFKEELDKELKAKTRTADLLYIVNWQGKDVSRSKGRSGQAVAERKD